MDRERRDPEVVLDDAEQTEAEEEAESLAPLAAVAPPSLEELDEEEGS